MILNLMRVEALKIEEMIKRSFSENATQALLPQHQRDVAVGQAQLDKIKREPCDICDIDLEDCHEAAVNYEELTKNLHMLILSTPLGRKMMVSKRLIVFKKDGIRTPGILIEDGYRQSGFKVLAIEHVEPKRDNTDILPYLPLFRSHYRPLPSWANQVKTSVVNVTYDDLEAITETLIKVRTPPWFLKIHKGMQAYIYRIRIHC